VLEGQNKIHLRDFVVIIAVLKIKYDYSAREDGEVVENILVNWAKICRNLNKRKQVSAVLIAADIFLPTCRLL
jgi:hypothetical protein